MANITGKIDIDFEFIPTYNPKKIMVADVGEWKHIEDKPSIVEITMPGNRKPIVVYWRKNKMNIFNSQNLGYTCDAIDDCDLLDLPDGIYEFVVKGSPSTFNKKKYYLRDVKTRLELDELLIEEGMDLFDIDQEKLESIQRIRMLLQAAESNTRYSYLDKANYYLKQAQKSLEGLKNCKDCNKKATEFKMN